MKSLSLCMIVRNEEGSLAKCLSSIKDYVQEIIIVDTGSADKTKEIAASFGAKVFDFNSVTNPEAFLMDDESTGAPPPYSNELILSDFGAARNYSFSKASSDFILWIDADDTVDNADKIPFVMSEMEKLKDPAVGWFKYDYSFSGDKPNCQLWRERIIKRGNGRWMNPIHEVHDVPSGTSGKFFTEISIRHHRELGRERPIANRNYKVLKKQYRAAEAAKKEQDPRTLFYLGNESKFLNLEESIGYYEQYLRASGWDEERSVARMFLGQLFEAKNDYEAAFRSYTSATVDFPSCPDPWFALARMAYMKNDWNRCIACADKGFALGSPDSAIMFNPLERSYTPHTYYNVALSKVGRVRDAIASCDAALQIYPEDGNLKFNKDLYEKYLREHPEPAPSTQSVSPTISKVTFATDTLAEEPKLPHNVTALLALQVWKEMLKYDEVVKARDYLNSLPYFVENDEQVSKAKVKTEELLAFLNTDEKTKQYYSTHRVEEAYPVDRDFPPLWSQNGRLSAIKLALQGKKHLRILDLGCQDGWVSNRLAMLGHSVVGVDFSVGHLKIARQNAFRLGLSSSFVEGYISETDKLFTEEFDIVICTEVIEHVDNLDTLLGALKRRLKPNGTLLLSTPKGSWLNGQQVKTGTGEIIGPKWDEPREHIRAFSLLGLQAELSKYFDVSSCYSIPMKVPDVEGQATLFAVCSKSEKPERIGKKLRIGIWTGPAFEWWNALTPYTTGIGGSETAAIEMAREFTKLGHDVKVYSDCPHMEGLYDGVRYVHFGRLADQGFDGDVFISSRQSTAILDAPIKAKIKVLWVHDIHCGGNDAAMQRSFLKYDVILCLSDWHRNFFLQTYPLLDPAKVRVTRNGIKTERFAEASLKRKTANKLIYTSSGNRGLETLLQWFPAIRARVPDVTLDIYYGFDTWRASVRGHKPSIDEINALENLAKATEGVTLRGRVNQTVLAEAFMDAKVWAYPTMFTETSCISAMEAQASGALVVTTEVAALGETVKYGILIAPPTGAQYKRIFVDAVVAGLQGKHADEQVKGMEHGKTLGWDALASDWITLFENLTAYVQDFPMPNYVSSQP